MRTLLFILLQTKGEATIIILSLLLVAAVIGYITSWLYYKAYYTRIIQYSDSEKEELNTLNYNLNADKINLEKIISRKDKEIARLMLDVTALKALHKEAVQENNDSTLKNKRTEQLLYEKNEALSQIAKRKHLLDYKNFGKATPEEKDDLKMISGIGPFIEERLHALDIYTFLQISRFTAHDIETINDAIDYFWGRIERDEWVSQARELVHAKERKSEVLTRIKEKKARIYFNRIGTALAEEADDLTTISGIGGWIKEKLNALDIYTFRQISNFTDEDIHTVTEAIEYFPGRIERDEWILQAQELVRIAGKKSELLKRISDRKERIYFDRLGDAHVSQANNLTLIKGIGLWIEERLNMLDIYTFEQIGRLTPADVETITEILEISPGRIERDNWVIQARGLAKKEMNQALV